MISVILGTGTVQAGGTHTIDLTIDGHQMRAEVVASDPARERGLMGRSSLPANHGMLFVFDRSAPECFWMKNTLLPLSIAFIEADGTILSIDQMQPLTETAHCPPGAILYALEMKQGWFKRAGIVAGGNVEGLPGH